MFEHRRPVFPAGALTKEVLCSLRNIAAVEQDIRYSEYSDGIVSGCELVEENMRIGVRGGVVKFAGNLYMLGEKMTVPYQPTESWTILKIRFGPQINDREYTLFQGQLALDGNLQISRGEMELGRFKLKQGSRLRTKYKDFRDLMTEYDTVDIVNVRQAAPQAYTLSPVITAFFAREAYAFVTEPVDIAFCTQCLASGEPVRRELIIRYVCRRRGGEYAEMDNAELHRHLSDILDEITGRGKPEAAKPQMGVMLFN